jgi:RNA polymerase sigma factor (sigma-70 family)
MRILRSVASCKSSEACPGGPPPHAPPAIAPPPPPRIPFHRGPTEVLNDLTTGFVGRLRTRDPAAWFELWENFGPVLRAQLARWGRGRIGQETVKDLSQETLAALAGAIDRHDPRRGARFSTWLLAIARHTLSDEIDRRMAQKRGAGQRALSLDGVDGRPDGGPAPDEAYERAVFDAKVAAALRAVERDCGFEDFSVYRMRVLQGRSGREVAHSLGTSEPTISRRLSSVRGRVRTRLEEVFSKFSFTEEEWEELSRNGLELNPNKKSEASFDEAVAEIFHRMSQRDPTGSAGAQSNTGGPRG